MRALCAGLLAIAMAASPMIASAHPGKGKGKGEKWHHTYRDGNCVVERKMNPGGYKEKVRCDGPAYYAEPAPVIVVPSAPVVVSPTPRITIDIPLR